MELCWDALAPKRAGQLHTVLGELLYAQPVDQDGTALHGLNLVEAEEGEGTVWAAWSVCRVSGLQGLVSVCRGVCTGVGLPWARTMVLKMWSSEMLTPTPRIGRPVCCRDGT